MPTMLPGSRAALPVTANRQSVPPSSVLDYVALYGTGNWRSEAAGRPEETVMEVTDALAKAPVFVRPPGALLRAVREGLPRLLPKLIGLA